MNAQGTSSREHSPGEDFGFRTDARWWLPKFKDKRYQQLGDVVSRIWAQQDYRRDLHLRHARLYGNLPILGLGPRAYARKALAGNNSKLAFNVIKSCCDAYTAKVTKDRPKVTFLTSGGDWDLQEKAKGLERFIDGQLYETQFHDMAPSVVLDSAIYGIGTIHPYITRRKGKKRIAIERVFPWEILIDDEEAVYGEPQNLYRRKYIDRVVLEAMFPEHGMEIAQAKREDNGVDEWGYDSTADQVIVTEAFHLKSADDADDGLHVIAISNATLLEERYERDHFPYITLRKQPCPIGWYPPGLSEELEGIQLELNVLLRKIQRSHHLLAAGHWLVQKGSLNKQKIDNEIGSILEYTGIPPQLVTGMAVSPDVYQHLDRLYQKAYEITGISQLQAQGLKPAGLDSGEAQRVYLDIQTERFQVSLHLYQHFYLELARHMLELAREISETDKSFGVKAIGRKEAVDVVFSKNFLDEEEYVLQLYPTNALSKEPASRIAEVQSLANAGWIGAQQAKRLLPFPDLEEAQLTEDVSYNLTMDMCAAMLHENRYIGPEPFMNLQESLKVVQLEYLKAKRDRAPENRLELFRVWMENANAMIQAATPPPPPPGPGAPPGAPPPPGAPANDNAAAPPGMPPGPPPGAAA